MRFANIYNASWSNFLCRWVFSKIHPECTGVPEGRRPWEYVLKQNETDLLIPLIGRVIKLWLSLLKHLLSTCKLMIKTPTRNIRLQLQFAIRASHINLYVKPVSSIRPLKVSLCWSRAFVDLISMKVFPFHF
jgi:hypothetical protein